MTIRRTALLAAACVLALSAVWWSGRAPAPLPEGPRQVLPASEFADAEAAIAYYRERLRRDEADRAAYAPLAQALLQHATATGHEAEFVPEARDVIEAGLRRAPDDYHLLLLKGALLNKLHRFEEARDLASALVDRHPRHAYPYGVLVDALVELGAYDEAVAALDTMLAVKPGIASYTRAAYLRELHGDSGGAIEAMRLAADAGLAGTAERSWALYQLGQLYLGEAKPDTAAFLFEGLLEERPDYAYAVAGLGHVALVRGEHAEAVRHLQTAYDMAPRAEFVELLAEAHAAAGNEARARAAAERVRAGLAEARAMGEDVEMEEADFMLDHGIEPERALAMAERQVRRRPGHLHALETYAWALHHNGRSAEAVPYVERALRLGTGDAMVHHRAAQIFEGAGRPVEAARHARLALENGLAIESPTAAAEARRWLAARPSGPPVRSARASRGPLPGSE